MNIRFEKTIFIFLVGQGCFVASAFLFNAVAARCLGPHEMGIWSLINLIAEYGMIVTCGVVNGMGREVPYLTGRGDLHATNSVVATTFKIVFLICCALFLVALSWTFLAFPYLYPVVLGITLLISRIIFSFSYILIRSCQDFSLLGLQQFTIGLIQAAGLLLVWQVRSVPAVLFGTVASLLCGAVFCKKFLVNARSAAYSTAAAKQLVRIGMPIFLVGIIYALFLSTDRVLIAKFLGVTKLGLYTPAIMAVGVTSLVPNIVSNVMYPKMAELYGKTESLLPLIPLVRKIMMINVLLTIVLAGLFLSIFNYIVIPFFLTDYAAAVPAMIIILIASIISTIGLSLGDLFNVLGVQRAFLTNISIATVVNFITGGLLLLTTGLELVGVSIGTLSAFMVFSGLQLVTYQRLLREQK